MKKGILHLLMMTIAISSFAQKMAHDRYTVSGGLLGALNSSKFRMDGDNPADISYDSKMGWSAGGWVNLPLGKVLSLEPEVMYSSIHVQGRIFSCFDPGRHCQLHFHTCIV